jgi:TPR repeat protein
MRPPDQPVIGPPAIPAPPTLPRKSRFAQFSLLLGFIAVLQFSLDFAPRAADAWDAVRDHNLTRLEAWDGLFGGALGRPAAICLVLTSAGMLCSVLAALRILTSSGQLKGVPLALIGFALSALFFGWLLESRGDFLPRTNATAEQVSRYRSAAEQNDPKAQYNLGLCYLKGTGVPKDEAEAARWFRKAAEQGHVWAQCNLGRCYAQGLGVTQDHTEALKWYRKAAEQKDALAQYCLLRRWLRGSHARENSSRSRCHPRHGKISTAALHNDKPKKDHHALYLYTLVGATGVEPARIAPKDPKSFASANSATRPSCADIFVRPRAGVNYIWDAG